MGYSPTGANRGKKYYSIFEKDVNRENGAGTKFCPPFSAQTRSKSNSFHIQSLENALETYYYCISKRDTVKKTRS